jgi:hypothetical protein
VMEKLRVANMTYSDFYEVLDFEKGHKCDLKWSKIVEKVAFAILDSVFLDDCVFKGHNCDPKGVRRGSD